MDYVDYLELWEDYYEQQPGRPAEHEMDMARPELQLHSFEDTRQYNGLMASLTMGNLG
ncbi:MAG: hypothetical protein JSW10_10490 [Pseudomonadota bacterium]|nr:MAG: hypothetical protein JSW10_10490 [Pseudomonadota bacterium]